MSKLCTSASFVLALLAGCATSPPEDPLYSGEYFYNFESSYLTPDGKNEAWCIDAGRMGRAMLPAKDVNGQWGTSRVVVRGKLGPRGSYGGLGRCQHVLDITEIVEVSDMRGRGE
ncbi:hypothetical protein [Pseudoxanthomonas japonensis]|uniref:hypothetical protein n=1 Tax=Pseudoxanthomonas japonensis TaxID=69284 RepID=UPI00374816E8